MLPQGAHQDAHVTTLVATSNELQNAEADKARLEQQRDQLIATAHRLGLHDEFQIAALTAENDPQYTNQSKQS